MTGGKMRMLTYGDFAGRVGKALPVKVEGGTVPLQLDSAQELPPSGRDGGAFRLEFIGPFQPMLAQAIYPFGIDGQRHDIFIVPIGQDQRGIRYEAIFY